MPATTEDPTPRRRRFGRPAVLLAGVVAAAALVAGSLALLSGRQDTTSQAATTTASPSAVPTGPSLLAVLSHVDPAVLRDVGTGGLGDPFTSLGQAPPLLDATRKPLVFFAATAGCLDCAAQRWSLVLALTRFGTVSHLPLMLLPRTTTSPAVSSFSFVGMTFDSPYLAFAGFEEADLSGRSLDTLSSTGRQLLDTYDVPPFARTAGGLPWLDVGNRFGLQGNAFSAQVLGDLTWDQVLGRLSSATDPVTRAVVGQANYITAAVCVATGMRPASACAAAPVPTLAAALR